MKKLLFLVLVLIAVIASLFPLSDLLVGQGLAREEESWAPEAVFGGARLQMLLFQYEEAHESFQQGLDSFPDYPKKADVLYWMASCSERSEHYRRALTEYERFLSRYPEHPRASQANRRSSLLATQFEP